MAEREIITVEDFPSNSHKSKEEVKVTEKIVTGEVVRKKKPLGKRVAETFLEDDTKSVGQHILYDVLIPAAKSTISEVITSGIQMLLYGGEGKSSSYDSRSTMRDRDRTYVSYNNIYGDRYKKGYVIDERNMSTHNFDDIYFNSKTEAIDVLSNLITIIEDYGQASVEDFYDLVGVSSKYTDSRWGWTDLRNAYIEKSRYGWFIKFPRTMVLS